MSLFDTTQEKGSGEWSAFRSVLGENTPGAFRVATPQKPNTPRYTNIVHINRYRYPRLILRGAR